MVIREAGEGERDEKDLLPGILLLSPEEGLRGVSSSMSGILGTAGTASLPCCRGWEFHFRPTCWFSFREDC